jgi:hypothetical protein
MRPTPSFCGVCKALESILRYYRQNMKLITAKSPVVTAKIQIAANFLLDIQKFGFYDMDKVSFDEIYLLLCGINQNSGV